MAAQLDLDCKACGGRHTFCRADSDFLDGNSEYEYTCPNNQQTARLTTEEYAEVVRACPKSAVILREVPH
jgi:hypothetical protein